MRTALMAGVIIRIWLTAERQGNEVAARVKDTGIGIAPDLLPRVFDLFVQGDRSLARSQGGLGVGLTLVRRLVEMHGGRVTAQSAGPNLGSEFVACLPALPQPRPDKSPLGADVAPAAGPSLRVLVVDDNVDAADGLALLLRMQGHEVHVAYDGAAALEAVRARQPAVVLLDLGLPILNGYEVAQLLQQQADRPKPVVVAVIGYGHDDARQQAQTAGFDRYLVKPVEPTELAQLLAWVANGPPGR
jgi:CheY-like chemotaxis protein